MLMIVSHLLGGCLLLPQPRCLTKWGMWIAPIIPTDFSCAMARKTPRLGGVSPMLGEPLRPGL